MSNEEWTGFPVFVPEPDWLKDVFPIVEAKLMNEIPEHWRPMGQAPKDGRWIIGYQNGVAKKVRWSYPNAVLRADEPSVLLAPSWCDAATNEWIPECWRPMDFK